MPKKKGDAIAHIPLLSIKRTKPDFNQAKQLAGVLGFEPRNGETKTRCLTTWRHPINVCLCKDNSIDPVSVKSHPQKSAFAPDESLRKKTKAQGSALQLVQLA